MAYAAAKHGVQGIVSLVTAHSDADTSLVAYTLGQIKAFSNGWASKGVCVNAIAPGYISTDVSEHPSTVPQAAPAEESAAEAVVCKSRPG